MRNARNRAVFLSIAVFTADLFVTAFAEKCASSRSLISYLVTVRTETDAVPDSDRKE